jgi:gamma-glutamylaminecyclotransferase
MNMHVLVYGTLLRGQPNHCRMSGARFVREARTEARYTLIDLGPFPALHDGGTTSVVGEVYEVGPELLAELDRFEGVPYLYERAAVALADGDVAEVYMQRNSSRRARGVVIGSGDWRAHRKGKSDAHSIEE